MLLWAIGFFSSFLESKIGLVEKDLPIILPYNEKVKEEPPEIELFPHSESPVWKNYKNESKEDKITDNDTEDKIAKNNNISNKKENFNNLDKNSQVLSDLKTDIKKDKKIDNKNNIKVKDIILNSETEGNKSYIENSEIKNEPDNAKELRKEIITPKSSIYTIQLASLSNEKLLESEWIRLKKKYFPKLNDSKYTSKKITLNNKVFHRLLVGAYKSKIEASKFCKKIGIESNCLIRLIK